MRQTRNIQRAAIAATIGLAASFAPPALAATGTNRTPWRSAVSAGNIKIHLDALQAIANTNGNNRAAGTSGYEASLLYVEGKLTEAGYELVRQPFSYDPYDLTSAALERVSPDPRNLHLRGGLHGHVLLGRRRRHGPADRRRPQPRRRPRLHQRLRGGRLAGFTPGNIALIQRGTCTFRIKADNAAAAGAAGPSLQPGQRRRGGRPPRPLRRHARPAAGSHPGGRPASPPAPNSPGSAAW